MALKEARYGHSATLLGNDIYVFGGLVVDTRYTCNRTPSHHMFKFSTSDLSTPTIVTPLSTLVIPPATHFHTTVAYNNKLYTFGGKCLDNYNCTHEYDVAQNQWSLLKTQNDPGARYGHCAVLYNDEMIIHGGYDNLGFACSDFQVLNLVDNKWLEFKFAGDIIQGRFAHSANLVDDLIVIYGGRNAANQVFNDLFIVNLKDKVIHAVTINSKKLLVAEDGRSGHVAVADKKDDKTIVLSVFGGRHGRNLSRHSIAFTIDLESYKASAEKIDHLLKPYDTPNVYPEFGSVTPYPEGLFFYGGMPINVETSKLVVGFDVVPDEVLRIIYDYLQWHEICHLSAVSRSCRLATLSNDNKYWKEKYESVITKVDYSPIVQKIKLDNSSNTGYKSAITKLIREYYAISVQMGYTQKQITKYIKRNVKLVRYREYLHGYIGAGTLKGLFTTVNTQDKLKKKFGSGVGIRKLYDPHIHADRDALGAKAVAVGDGAVGKTCLLITALGHNFPEEYVPTVLDNDVYQASLFGAKYQVNLWDTVGPEQFDRLRPLSYPQTNVFLLCFSITNPASFANIKTMWLPEITHYYPKAAILLIGTKQDLRNNEAMVSRLKEKKQEPISYEQGANLAKELGCIAYLETSSLNRVNVDQLADYIMYASILHETINDATEEKKRCAIA